MKRLIGCSILSISLFGLWIVNSNIDETDAKKTDLEIIFDCPDTQALSATRTTFEFMKDKRGRNIDTIESDLTRLAITEVELELTQNDLTLGTIESCGVIAKSQTLEVYAVRLALGGVPRRLVKMSPFGGKTFMGNELTLQSFAQVRANHGLSQSNLCQNDDVNNCEVF